MKKEETYNLSAITIFILISGIWYSRYSLSVNSRIQDWNDDSLVNRWVESLKNRNHTSVKHRSGGKVQKPDKYTSCLWSENAENRRYYKIVALINTLVANKALIYLIAVFWPSYKRGQKKLTSEEARILRIGGFDQFSIQKCLIHAKENRDASILWTRL